MAEHSLDAAASNEEVLSRIGHMTRALHDSLRGLGLDKLIEKAASDIPDARDRLDYVARLSEQSAKRVLDATDTAGPLQDGIEQRSGALRGEWQALLDKGGAGDTDWRALAERTMAALAESEQAAVATRGQLMDIMMAQDFQDLTGQVIGKITSIAQDLEKQLVQVLIDFAPSEIKRELDTGLLNGPQIKPEGNTEIVANQGQVDDLLDSLGF
ncbi:protein phosphatase CheZ [Massilia sp. YIM B02769]|jgi:chemotaxis protein CheZ|uniref:protein phosphatase CheZ n=1 Tax=unclassified Massilia TaxID=2609279 RepID=UPI0025B715D3|nr:MULTISPECIES: protein phosphatase CheZ [unclassified Massilia]MDN4058322.1 protein phosphatase CheZ [Massilia sp. YIM B02769]